MDRALALFGIGLAFGGGIGFVVAAGAGVTLDGHDHGPQGAAHAERHRTPHVLPDGPDAPALRMTLSPDPQSGWNLHVDAAHFRFAPESAGGAHVPGEGHAHVYVDGDRIARLYGPWMHIPALPVGATVEVTLHANDHRPLAVGSVPVAVSTRVASE